MKDINLNQALQEVEILNITPNPIETIYKAYKQCYAKGKAKDIVIPTKEIKNGGASTRVVDYEKMENFIVPLMNDGHTSPLEHCCVTFAVSGVSRALTHQLVRHRTGKYNQQSQRYVDFTNFEFVLPNRFSKEQNSLAYAEFYKAMEEDAEHYDNLVRLGIAKEIEKLLSKETKAKLFSHVHGKKPSKEALDYMFILIDGYSANRYVEAYKELFPKVYRMIKKRVQEDARYVLSNATSSNIMFTMDFNNFRKFYGLRNCVNAQWEIRELAQKCGELLEDYVPFILNGARNCGKICNECGGK